ncbi:nucleotidyltransferase domain-containing protein [Amycolatopsis sp. OK19-0408]|uniref:Nucleotidyltransferase domain-containing protein n=1 Tax=Amycolatopsis iheyensis TaxID=2945988 RepID=A0A9X2NF13_9PSEU|nr:nucleotidyltransferase domain-containing protein [Amycolatopsis iheyensis]MCR6487591.1 nucleotidyltransferase domain-containing protein [Amycolatopsis iheyensis]
MYTPGERQALREALVEAARSDERVTGAALTGSAALDAEDAWSDIDLAFAVAGEPAAVLADFTTRMYGEHGAVHHMDVVFERTVFRVFLLANTLQVDLAFWPAADFGATTPKFRLLFGTAQDRPRTPPPEPRRLIDLAWLHALHARSSIERGRGWQAEYMIGRVREHALALACLRHGLPAVEGRGLDRLPASVTAPYEATLVRGLEDAARAFHAVTELFIGEIEHVDGDLARRLAPLLRELS